jgi:hypothetical protein
MDSATPIALDTETTLIRPGVLAPEMVCVSWASGSRSEVLHHSDPEARIVVEEALLYAFTTSRRGRSSSTSREGP